jgi:sucrose phosphorylase
MSRTRTRQGVQLIAYADRFGGSIDGLHRLLDGPLADVFDGVHLLPFFTPYDGADAGFDPVDHTRVDERLGSWTDVQALAQDYTVMADLIVNHVSADSPQFQDVLAHGSASLSADMFLTMSKVFPAGASEAELAAIYRPRPGLPFVPLNLGGVRRLVWTTFTSQQIDIDVAAPAARAYLDSVVTALTDGGATMLRLDAVGYAVKTAGTSSFMTPETFSFIRELATAAREREATVLVEVHAHHAKQVAIAAAVDLVYDFALPPLLLHALSTADAGPLLRWLQIRPGNAVTVLDTHDGIGVIDVGPDQSDQTPGLLTPEQIDSLVEGIHERTEGRSRQATGWASSNVDVYQVNSTYYDALGRDDRAYLLARAVQFFTPGIPQVYYVGLLAGTNDMDLLARTGVGRDINRHHYTDEEISEQLDRPVVQALIALIRFRNAHPAFAGSSSVTGTDTAVRIEWTHGDDTATLLADFSSRSAHLTASAADGADTGWVNLFS